MYHETFQIEEKEIFILNYSKKTACRQSSERNCRTWTLLLELVSVGITVKPDRQFRSVLSMYKNICALRCAVRLGPLADTCKDTSNTRTLIYTAVHRRTLYYQKFQFPMLRIIFLKIFNFTIPSVYIFRRLPFCFTCI